MSQEPINVRLVNVGPAWWDVGGGDDNRSIMCVVYFGGYEF